MNEYYLPYEAHASGLPLTRNPQDIPLNSRLFQEVAFIASIPRNKKIKGLSDAQQMIFDAILEKESFPEIYWLSQYSRVERMVKTHLDHYISLKEKFPNGWEDDSN